MDFWKKMDEMSKIWASSGVLRLGVVTLRSGVVPRQGVASHVVAWLSGRQVKPLVRRNEGLCYSVAVLCHGIATVHSM